MCLFSHHIEKVSQNKSHPQFNEFTGKNSTIPFPHWDKKPFVSFSQLFYISKFTTKNIAHKKKSCTLLFQ